MKILFWILALISIPVSLFISAVCYFAYGLDLSSNIIGDISYYAGMVAVPVCLVCCVLGFIKLRKGDIKKAIIIALISVCFPFICIGGFYLDEAVGTVFHNRAVAERNDQLYGEGWNAPSALDNIPKMYQEYLNKYYVAVKEEWPSDQLMDLCVVSMADYYGDSGLDNIGFNLMDINGDGTDELLIGTVSPTEAGCTAIFCLMSDPQNPFQSLLSIEGEIHYMYFDEAEGAYIAQIDDRNEGWLLGAYEDESIVDIIYTEREFNPADRLTIEMIPFSQYK